jgi:parallel beta-helix repeat protein
VIKNNYFRSNYGHGFWCDLGCTDATITRNVASGNLGHGMYYEVSARAIVASNIFSENGKCGLKISGSATVRVYNNVFNRNAINLGVYDDGRASSTDGYSSSLGLVWDTRYTEIRNNLFSVGFVKASNLLGQTI